MSGYRLLTYRSPSGENRAGILVGDRILDVALETGFAGDATVLGVLDRWDAARHDLTRTAAQRAYGGVAFSEHLLEAPLTAPSAIYCAGANYTDHVVEMSRKLGHAPEPDPRTVGLGPWHFLKATRSIVGPNANVRIPAASKKVDWEIELVAVIGRQTRDVAAEDALGAVAGYTIANDLSCRDIAWRPPLPPTSPFFADWLAHKSFDGSCPLGPWIVPAADVPDPQDMRITLELNGVVRQDSSTSRMIFTIAEQIAQLSRRMTLYPGDLVLTGTPAGVGAAVDEFLKAGDEIRLSCEGIGSFTHRMVA